MHNIEPIHVFITLIISVFTLGGIIWRIVKTAGKSALEFRESIIQELKVTRFSIKELLGDLAERNPEAIGRIAAAMNEQSVLDFVRTQEKKGKT